MQPGDLLRLARPRHWAKNALVAVPALAAHQIDAATLARVALAFVVMGLASSAVYAVNDAIDRDQDRRHPRKRLRPVASGAVPRRAAVGLGIGTGAVALGLALAGGAGLLAVTAAYLALALGYVAGAKRIVWLDIAVLAALYTLRILVGSAATGIEASGWLLAFSLALFLSLAAVKRQAELAARPAAESSPLPGRGYGALHRKSVTGVAVASGLGAMLVLLCYLQSEVVRRGYSDLRPLWGGAAIMAAWIGRVLWLGWRGRITDDPVDFALRDWVSWLVCLAILGLAVLAI